MPKIVEFLLTFQQYNVVAKTKNGTTLKISKCSNNKHDKRLFYPEVIL